MPLEHQRFFVAEEKFRGAIKTNGIFYVEGFDLAKFFEVGSEIAFRIFGQVNDNIAALLPEGCPGFAILGEPFAEIAFYFVMQRNHDSPPLCCIFDRNDFAATHRLHIRSTPFAKCRNFENFLFGINLDFFGFANLPAPSSANLYGGVCCDLFANRFESHPFHFVTSCFFVAGSFPLTFLYIEFSLLPVNRLNKLFSRIFKKLRFSHVLAILLNKFYNEKDKKKSPEIGKKEKIGTDSGAVLHQIGKNAGRKSELRRCKTKRF